MGIDQLRDKRIGVLCGGQSSEREVSLRSGQGVREALARQGLEVVAIDPGLDLVGQLHQAGVEVALESL